jgi:hypothetical protein
MLTQEQSERLTRVGPGTFAGELLRRYWHPVAVARELTEENPTKHAQSLQGPEFRIDLRAAAAGG